MSGAIEVLRKERLLYVEKIRDIREGNKTRPSDIVKMYQKTINIYQEFIEALDEAIVCLKENKRIENMGFCCDSCGSETASCLTLCPECNERKQGALEELECVLNILETWEKIRQINPIIIDLIKDRIENTKKELEEGVEK